MFYQLEAGGVSAMDGDCERYPLLWEIWGWRFFGSRM